MVIEAMLREVQSMRKVGTSIHDEFNKLAFNSRRWELAEPAVSFGRWTTAHFVPLT